MAKILIIEDNPYDARLMSTLLRKDGHEVLTAEEGDAGLELARSEHPDLVLVDMGLPDIDGQTVIAQLRNDERVGQPIIITVTAWPPDTARFMAEAYGSDGYISKPFKVRTFQAKIRAFLETHQAGKE